MQHSHFKASKLPLLFPCRILYIATAYNTTYALEHPHIWW